MADEPQVLRRGAGYLISWAEPISITARVDRLREDKGDLKAEVDFKSHRNGQEKPLLWSTLNLSSSAARLKRAKELSAFDTEDWHPMWGSLVDQLANVVRDRERAGEPLRMLSGDPGDYPLAIPYLLRPLILEKHATILYGEGGLLKSWLALWMAMLLVNGLSSCGLTAIETMVLYLDWERSEQEINRRIAMLKAGGGFSPDLVIPYRRCYMSLGDELEEIMEMVAGLSVRAIIIDSLLGASGGENLNDTKTAGKFFQAFRKLNTGGLVIAHTQKGNLAEKTVLGAGSWENQASSVWEVKAPKEPGAVEIPAGLLHKKVNIGRQHLPLAFLLKFGGAKLPQDSDTWARVTAGDITDVEGAEKGIPTWMRLRELLRGGQGKTISQAAEELAIQAGTVKTILNRYKKVFVSFGDAGREKLWGLLSYEVDKT